MLVKKFKILFLMLMILPYALYAWGDGDKLSDGSCKFDVETGYLNSSFYLKGNESFLIMNGGDSRYGTISTIYNALTCEKVTSGDPVKSDFSGLMERKGFIQIDLSSNKVMDKSFQHKINFSKNSDALIIKIKPIESSVTKELKTLLASLSDKSAGSNINISNSAKEFLSYIQFYNAFSEKLNSLSATEINFDYALALNKKLKTDDNKGVILAKQEEVKKRLAKIEEKRKKKAIEYHEKMITTNLQAFVKHYGISNNIYKNEISWKPNQKWIYPSNNHSITGEGTIWFNPYGSMLDDAYIKGEFRDGKLISNANLKISGSECVKSGFFGCKESRGASDSMVVTAQNLASSISSLSSTVENRVYDKVHGGYTKKKSVGEKVCMSGRIALGLIGVDISAYVESISGDRIQLRISDTEGQNPYYNDTKLRQGTIIWDDYYNWEPCR